MRLTETTKYVRGVMAKVKRQRLTGIHFRESQQSDRRHAHALRTDSENVAAVAEYSWIRASVNVIIMECRQKEKLIGVMDRGQ